MNHCVPVLGLTLVCLASIANADPAVWSGPPVEFTKEPFASWMEPESQDRLTSGVWLTRNDTGGLFNAATETVYTGQSPAGTEWALGTTADLGSLTFSSFGSLIGLGGPLGGIGNVDPGDFPIDFVVHLTAEDIYVDISLSSWSVGLAGGGTGGGGFSYTRPSAVPEPAAAALLGLGAVLVRMRGRRRS